MMKLENWGKLEQVIKSLINFIISLFVSDKKVTSGNFQKQLLESADQASQSEVIPEYVTQKEFLMGRDVEYPLNGEFEENMEELLIKINLLRHQYKKPFIVSSGYRPGKYNKSAGGSKASAHLSCQAIDLKDPKKHIKKWLLDNIPLLESLGLYMEHPDYTPTWVHLQTRPTKNRIFIPY